MPVNSDGSLRPYNDSEIAAWNLGTRGIRDGSNPTETYSPDGSGCERKWLCNWQTRFDTIKMFVGDRIVYTDGFGVKQISRLLPQSHPTFTQWIAVKAVVTGHKFIQDDSNAGSGNLMPRWDAAEITVQYEQVPFKLFQDSSTDSEIQRYVTEPGYPGTETEPFSEGVSMPGGIMQWVVPGGAPPHGKPVNHNIVVPQAGEKIQAIWHRVPDAILNTGQPWFTRVYGDPLNGVRPWIGSLNKTPLFGRPPLTCLLESVLIKRRPDPTGFGYSYDVHFAWISRAQTHLQYFFWETANPPVIASGYQLVGKTGLVYADPTTFADTDSLHHIRDHAGSAVAGLFSIT